MAKYLDGTGLNQLWTAAKNTFANTSHTHSKITHSLWTYESAIDETATPQEICNNFGVSSSGSNAVFTAVVKDTNGARWQSLYWTNYGGCGLVELGKTYGSSGRLRYRVATGWTNGQNSWRDFSYIATTDDLTWNSISGKPTSFTPAAHNHDGTYLKLSGGILTGDIQTATFSSGVDGSGSYIQGTSNVGLRIQYYKTSTTYDQLFLKNGELKFNNNLVYHAGNFNPANYASSGHNHDLVYAKKYSTTFNGNSGVRITYTSYTPVIICVSGSNSGAQLIIVGSGYGEEGRARNDFTELVSSDWFDWSIPNSPSISRSVEVYSRRGENNNYITVISSDAVSFTTISELTTAKENATLLTSRNYTSWAAASNHTHTLASLGAASSTHNHDSSYVSSLGTSGNNLVWTKNGTDNTITVPYATSAGGVTWNNVSGKPSSYTPSTHYHNFIHGKNFYQQYSGYGGLPSNLTPSQIMSAEGITESNVFAFSAFTDDGTGLKTSFFWSAWGKHGVNEIRSSYGDNSHLQYRVSKSYPSDEWQAYKTLANTDDLTWTNISSKPDTATRWPAWSEVTDKPTEFTPASHSHSYLPLSGGTLTGNLTLPGWYTGFDSLGTFIEGNKAEGFRIQYPRTIDGTARSNYDQLLLKDGELKFNSNLVYHAGNLTPSIIGASASNHTHNDNYSLKFSHTLPANKAVRVSYSANATVLISVCGSNSGAQLVIVGTGYGEGGRIRNQFTELVSCSLFDWSIPNSNSISCSVEIFSRRGGDSTIWVQSTNNITFTDIDSLTSTKENATLLTSGNYTTWAATAGHNHSGVYSEVGHTHSYLPLSGGTLTGKLNVYSTASDNTEYGSYLYNYVDSNQIRHVTLVMDPTNPVGVNSDYIQLASTSDGNSFLDVPASGIFTLANTMYVKRSGNVGIGTNNPSYKLDVSGSLNATTLYQNGVQVSVNGHTHSEYAASSHEHVYITGKNWYSSSVSGSGHSAVPSDWGPRDVLSTAAGYTTSMPFVFAAFSEPNYRNSLFWTGYGEYGLTELRSVYGGVNSRLQYRTASGYSGGNAPTWGDFHTLAWTDDIPSAMSNSDIDSIIV